MNDLLIVTKIKQTTIYINKILINFPKNEIILKHHIEIDLYDLLRYIYEANYNKENRISILYKSLIKIKMLDFYIRICLEKNIVSYKKFISICTYLNEITKMIFGWIKSEKKKFKI